MNPRRTRPPELMSPAGHWPQLRAAVEAGADAVYFGLRHFSARGKVGFGLDELPEAIATLHERGVQGFVTFNTLVFDHELAEAERALVAIAAAGADAVIVQDVGVARLVRTVAPGLAVHGSTQMSVTSAQGVAFAASFGCSRVVLGRELSIADLRRIAEATDVELEVFVHGALCVSYSGQCFSSEAWGGRSANRGQCAQACRLAYDLVVDGSPRELLDERYLLSPGDLMALAQVPELIDIGIDCFKIEGRYKDADYVALTTAAYRQAIDDAWAAAAAARPAPAPDPAVVRDLEGVYSRGLGPWFIAGTDHQTPVRGRAPRHRGLRLGTVVRVVTQGTGAVIVAPPAADERPGPARADRRPEARSVAEAAGRAPRPGDGLVFDAAHRRSPGLPEQGGRVYGVEVDRDGWRLTFGRGDVELRHVRPGDAVWRSHDPALHARAKRFTEAGDPLRTHALSIAVTAHEGAPLVVVATTERGESAVSVGEDLLAHAASRPLDLATARAQLGRLGGTPFHLGDVTLDVEGAPFVPVSRLNDVRRDLVAQLVAARRRVASPGVAAPGAREAAARVDSPGVREAAARVASPGVREAAARKNGADASRPPGEASTGVGGAAAPIGVDAPPPPGEATGGVGVGSRGAFAPRGATATSGPTPTPVPPDAPARLHVLVRTGEQLDAALSAHAAGVTLESVTLDYLELYGLRPSVERARAAGVRVRVASPRVLKPAEQNVVRFLLDLEAELLVRSAGLLRDLAAVPAERRPRLTGDFSLGAANALTARAFLEAGCEALTPSYDLDADQVATLAGAIDPRRLEVVVHHHLPVFHTEHCVFCRFLSDGHDHTDCGHPCEQHRLALRDGQGRLHPVLADVGCRNTVFGAEAQSAARHLARWRGAGLRDARVEFVHAGAIEVAEVLGAWRAALDGALSPVALEARLRAAVPPGLTEGSYFVPHAGMRELPLL
jgi:U32 family peptidase